MVFQDETYADQCVVVGRIDEGEPELMCAAGERFGTVCGMCILHFPVQLLKRCTLLGRGTCCGVRRQRGVERDPGREPVKEVIVGIHWQAVPSIGILDEAFAGELKQRLSDGRTRHSVLSCQFNLD